MKKKLNAFISIPIKFRSQWGLFGLTSEFYGTTNSFIGEKKIPLDSENVRKIPIEKNKTSMSKILYISSKF